jgi:hypothetical protein
LIFLSSTERFPLPRSTRNYYPALSCERGASLMGDPRSPLPSIVNAEVLVGKDDLTVCDQVK